MSELVVHHLPAAWGLMSISPFCLKLDAWLRIASIPHKSIIDGTPFGAPKGKLPYIEYDGTKLGDSGFVIDYLKTRFGVDPDAHLTAEQRGVSLALRRLIEENLYWTMVFDRWVVDSNWALFKPIVLGGVPAAVRPVVAIVARRGVRAQLRGHGIGIHAPTEIHAIGRRDIAALSDVLGDKPFFFGDTPTEIDAIAYGQLANMAKVPIESPLKQEILGRKNLADFLDRFHARYYAA
jgi:glutathione S-transferase